MPILSPPPETNLLDAERRRHPAIAWESPGSIQSGKDATDDIFLRELSKTAEMSAFHTLEQQYAELIDELDRLASLDQDWDTFGSNAPSKSALFAAKGALLELKSFRADPTAIRPSSEGGVGICFTHADAYAHLEFLNDGSVHALAYSNVRRPVSWEVSRDLGIGSAWKRIHAFLQP